MRSLVTASLSAAALVLSGLMADTALSQDKVSIKVLSENDKVRIFEATYAPGAENPSPPLPPSGAYTTKNVGKTKLQLYVVAVK